jgi:ABC-type transporter Mla subunit MlaD
MAVDRSQNRNAIIGASVVLGLIAVTVLVFFIPDLKRFFQPSVEIIALLDEARGLEDGAQVWIAGREVGSVVSVQMQPAADDSQRIVVRMDIPTKYLTHVRTDSDVRVTTRRMIGEPVLDVIPGSPGARQVRDGDTLDVREPSSLTGVLDRTMSLSQSFQMLFADLRSTQRRASRRNAEIQRLNRNLQATMTQFRDLTAALSESPMHTFTDPEFKRLIDNLRANTAELSKRLQVAGERARAAKTDAQPAINSLMARTDTIRAVLADIQKRIDSSGGGLLIRAQKDSAIVKGLHKAQEQLDSLIAVTKRNPSRFWF